MIVVEPTTAHWLLKGSSRRVFRVRGDVVRVECWDRGVHARTETLDRARARRRWQWLVKQGWEPW